MPAFANRRLRVSLCGLQLHRAVLRSDPGTGRRKALWRTPVRCRITGAITLSALEGRSGRDSPQTLVTCIVRADFGGWLGSDSMFYGLGQVGLGAVRLFEPQLLL